MDGAVFANGDLGELWFCDGELGDFGDVGDVGLTTLLRDWSTSSTTLTALPSLMGGTLSILWANGVADAAPATPFPAVAALGTALDPDGFEDDEGVVNGVSTAGFGGPC
jgi:hypothetical protein